MSGLLQRFKPRTGQFFPVDGGYIYQVGGDGASYLVSSAERSRQVVFILVTVPLTILFFVALAVFLSRLAVMAMPWVANSFPALLLIGLGVMALLYLSLIWVFDAPRRAFSSRTPMNPEEADDLCARFYLHHRSI